MRYHISIHANGSKSDPRTKTWGVGRIRKVRIYWVWRWVVVIRP
jgi:hypothetical protein